MKKPNYQKDSTRTDNLQGTITPEMLSEMASVDIRDMDQENLVDIDTVNINQDLPVKERVQDYIRQIKNPYCYISHGVIVKIGFSGTRTLEECLGSCISMEA